MTFDKAKTELAYIKSKDPVYPGDSFNNDADCFARYCNMQANAFDQWPLIAEEMRQSRDIANPTFRSDARKAGWLIEGTKATLP